MEGFLEFGTGFRTDLSYFRQNKSHPFVGGCKFLDFVAQALLPVTLALELHDSWSAGALACGEISLDRQIICGHKDLKSPCLFVFFVERGRAQARHKS